MLLLLLLPAAEEWRRSGIYQVLVRVFMSVKVEMMAASH